MLIPKGCNGGALGGGEVSYGSTRVSILPTSILARRRSKGKEQQEATAAIAAATAAAAAAADAEG